MPQEQSIVFSIEKTILNEYRRLLKQCVKDPNNNEKLEPRGKIRNKFLTSKAMQRHNLARSAISQENKAKKNSDKKIFAPEFQFHSYLTYIPIRPKDSQQTVDLSIQVL